MNVFYFLKLVITLYLTKNKVINVDKCLTGDKNNLLYVLGQCSNTLKIINRSKIRKQAAATADTK